MMGCSLNVHMYVNIIGDRNNYVCNVCAVQFVNIKFGKSDYNATWRTFSLMNGIIIIIECTLVD